MSSAFRQISVGLQLGRGAAVHGYHSNKFYENIATEGNGPNTKQMLGTGHHGNGGFQYHIVGLYNRPGLLN